MKRLALAAALALSVPSVVLACEGEDHQAKAAVKNVTITELAALQKDSKARVFDANGPETRTKYGVIPGAVLLTSAVKYDAAKELPAAKDSKLVFYCASTHCTSSDTAARKALEAGYTDVAVLKEGIVGWKKAGQATATPRS